MKRRFLGKVLIWKSFCPSYSQDTLHKILQILYRRASNVFFLLINQYLSDKSTPRLEIHFLPAPLSNNANMLFAVFVAQTELLKNRIFCSMLYIS